MRKTKNTNNIKVNTDLIKKFKELVDSSFSNDDDCLSTLLIVYELKKTEESSSIRLKEYIELKTYLNCIESIFNSICDENNKEIINMEKEKTKDAKDNKSIIVNKNIFQMFRELVKTSFKNEDDCLYNLIFTYQLYKFEKNSCIKKMEKEHIKLQKYLYYIKYLFINTIEEYNNEKELIIKKLQREIKELNKLLKNSKKDYNDLLKENDVMKNDIKRLKMEVALLDGKLDDYCYDDYYYDNY